MDLTDVKVSGQWAHTCGSQTYMQATHLYTEKDQLRKNMYHAHQDTFFYYLPNISQKHVVLSCRIALEIMLQISTMGIQGMMIQCP